MRVETRAVKSILKYYFPDNNFRLKFKESYSHIDSDDKIIVTCLEKIDLDIVVSRLREHTSGVRVYKSGDPVYARETEEIQFRIPDTKEIINGELLDFIEVKYI